MSLASVTIAFLAALARPRPVAEPDPSLAALQSENARLRRDLVAAQALLAETQRRGAAAEGQARRLGALQQSDLGAYSRAQQLGAQTLALDPEFWRNCTPSRAQVFGAWRG
jgi:hypothetical protein